MYKIFVCCILLMPFFCKGQPTTYADSSNNFIRNYVSTHELVKGQDRELLQFFSADSKFRVEAIFTPAHQSDWFWMATSGTMKQQYRKYGLLTFTLLDTAVQLTIFQSRALMAVKDYSDYLFLPFSDQTNGFATYGGGRYIDLKISDITKNVCIIDFNKAYNPYCAYANGYDCPIPPKENDLKVSVHAGEMRYSKH